MATREVYWHLPGFYYFKLFHQVLLNLMKDYPNRFRKGYRIGSVYGTFPGAIWNGGRTVFGIVKKADMESTLRIYNSRGIPVRFTWTNSLLEEQHVQDTYCNLIMRLGDNGLNQVLVNRPVLEDHIRANYPDYKVISSTTKRITGRDELLAEFQKDYDLVVLDYDLNHDGEVLRLLEPYADRVELLVNEVCFPGCPKRVEHYEHQSRMQLEFDMSAPYPCPNRARERKFEECMTRPAFISNEEIGSYIDRGFVNFKIAGRGMPVEFLEESCLYFLVNDGDRDFIREKIDGLMQQLTQAQRAQTAQRR